MNLSSAVPSTPTAPPKTPAYPRVNLAPCYEVVRGWPQRPADIQWGAVTGVAIDARGDGWICTRNNPVVQVYSPDGTFLRGWREEDPRAVPHALKFDAAGDVWLVDAGLHVARKFDPEGRLLVTMGVPGEAGEDGNHFNCPTDIALTPDGSIFVSDGYGNSRIAHFDSAGRFVKSWGSLGVEPGQFSIAHAIVSDSRGRLYVADRNNVRVQVFDREGRLLDVWSNILVPWGLWVSPADEIWACGSSPMTWATDGRHPEYPLGCPPQDQLLVRFNPAGRVLELTRLPKGEDGREEPGEVNWLHNVAFDTAGNLYVGDIMGKRVQKFRRH